MTRAGGELLLDGRTVAFEPGESLLELARRRGAEVPALCHDPRLEPAAVCRSCLVEVDGERRLVPACRTSARAGLVVTTASERVRRHRRALFALQLADHPRRPEDCQDGAPCAVCYWAVRVGAPRDWAELRMPRGTGPAWPAEDDNPHITFRPDRCILCARCTRYCAEVEGVGAITLAGRGAATTISTADGRGLLETTCELCGGCVALCPTGAMADRRPLESGAPPESELRKVRSTCNYCGVGCQLDLNVDPGQPGGRVIKVTSPPAGTLAGDGNLCVKGRFAHEFIHAPERLTSPLLRGADGVLREVGWEVALAAAARGLRDVEQRHGARALGFVSSSRCTVEENYLVQKMARGVFGTNNVHQCAAT
jgi:predicted molibdopterin-dependent oxidoreductase YjgC